MGTLGWLALSPSSETPGYFKTIPEVKQMGDQAHAKHLRVNGYVKEGSVVNWMVECGPPNALFRNHVTPKALPLGEIVVDGYQAKDGTLRVNGRDITFAGGKKVFVWPSGLRGPNGDSTE